MAKQEQQGTVKRIVKEKGFGFLRAQNGDAEYFFHRSEVKPHSSAFDSMSEGDTVSFTPGNGPKGPRAENVTVS